MTLGNSGTTLGYQGRNRIKTQGTDYAASEDRLETNISKDINNLRQKTLDDHSLAGGGKKSYPGMGTKGGGGDDWIGANEVLLHREKMERMERGRKLRCKVRGVRDEDRMVCGSQGIEREKILDRRPRKLKKIDTATNDDGFRRFVAGNAVNARAKIEVNGTEDIAK